MKIKTRNVFPPIPWRNFDWAAWDDDSCCCPECNPQIGRGPTEEAAIADLMEQLEEVRRG